MIFVHGYVHCDPHPGNVLVRNTPKKELEIVLLDHGLYQVRFVASSWFVFYKWFFFSLRRSCFMHTVIALSGWCSSLQIFFHKGRCKCHTNVFLWKLSGQTNWSSLWSFLWTITITYIFPFFQALSDSFRLNYARLWQSILAADINGIKRYSETLGAGEMYGLFACMLTARSWESVSRGIDKKDRTQSEVKYQLH